MPSAKIFPAAVLLFVSVVTAPAETNFCHDPQAEKEWTTLTSKYPHDSYIQALHALRIGLCIKIDRGDLEVSRASRIFEEMRKAVIRVGKEERMRKNRQKKPSL